MTNWGTDCLSGIVMDSLPIGKGNRARPFEVPLALGAILKFLRERQTFLLDFFIRKSCGRFKS